MRKILNEFKDSCRIDARNGRNVSLSREKNETATSFQLFGEIIRNALIPL